ncbi:MULTISPECIES: pyruvate dehydrogenase complex dihydrolipoamide acetyltransferase [Bosea]|uniref:pyruvate dehydrogenase complex dihydrolipoamide acetyltransferase n=1 Tax=Bosea TaxID=85413 RepID=UPI00214FF9CD|nr:MULTISPECIES: pyruvate dehydrogenase complex dihydrolipoamide acetyltransferase [Bosea]MCR4523762.1 pyruvate dehydrogenase complex dihydrolipoamide acetyltransferase [Bosea sp. 47.2.35]MDR6830029.1 pyruvate dehydrogenase E2 component (dihydrolipoamide acetyltransferase) [Bosea robiniae]MDR6897010.1 pyruvate dehydrogenase E2 component (dihydrolipoamide acetyltransferase) [Bosea sp. BE109]MDR7140309.1 pyruvate dehydrogenase E2 component (dihydrolipoamide acetyltransferase) [Bosea sp. BE168]MD
MPTNILMPALSPTMEKGNLAKWLKKEGDTIKSGDIIAEIETDKATMEVEAVDEGVLAKIVVPEGTADVAVNEIIGVIAGEGEDAKSVSAPAAGGAAPAKSDAPKAEAPKAGAADTDSGHVTGNGKPLQPQSFVAASGNASRAFASPLARRIAKDAGLDLNAIKGSGPHGRIVEKDVEAAKAGGGAKAAPAAAAAGAPAAKPAAAPLASGPSDEQVKKLFEPGSYEEVPHDGMRKTIARRLTEAKQTVPHFYVTVDCELDALLKLRGELNAAAPEKDGKPAYKLSVNDMVIKALALALKAVPDANVSWTDNTMLKHKHADVGVAVSIPGGLITPIIRDACHKSLSQISNEMKDMAARAKARKLKPEEYQGGTTAVSNLGMFGVKDFAAIVNPPHATILAVGAGEQRVIVKGGQPAVATVMSVTLSTDHRAVDGALGAELLAAFKGYIEKPLAMLV